MQAVGIALWFVRQKARTETIVSSAGNVVYFRYTTPSAAATETVNKAASGFLASIHTMAAGTRNSRPMGAKAMWVRLSPDSSASGRIAVTVGRAISNRALAVSQKILWRVDSQAAATRTVKP